ncbi:MAG TPA: ribosome biogenesis GTPase Der [Prolixibacteraceae bacterium]|nr:ribosome biogenesis GTPase Der [Prolixibacteraceae bacterium]
MSSIVAIVGRPNVGKSTFFNRLTESRAAIVDDMPGVTRDRNYGKSIWNGVEFSVIDTGGYVSGSDDVFEEEIRRQANLAIQEADVIVFLVDVESGLTELDISVYDLLRRNDKPVVTVVNKVDNHQRGLDANEFYSLGVEKLFTVSSINGLGTGDLLDEIVELLPKVVEEVEDEKIPRIAVVGRPNVGKSSIINTLVGEDRHIVTEVAGTTRDAVAQHYNKFGHNFILVDTAGLRKKTKVAEDVEFYSVMRSVRTIEDSDVCVLVLDATRGVEGQDVSIFHLIHRNKKGIVVVVNKWDLVEKDNHTMKSFERDILEKFAPIVDIPIVFTSALTKQRILKILEEAMMVFENRNRHIATSKLNELLLGFIEAYPPPAHKGKYIKIKYITQLPTKIPSFAFFCNLPQYIRDPYKRYLENKIRSNFNFKGIPIQLYFRQK